MAVSQRSDFDLGIVIPVSHDDRCPVGIVEVLQQDVETIAVFALNGFSFRVGRRCIPDLEAGTVIVLLIHREHR